GSDGGVESHSDTLLTMAPLDDTVQGRWLNETLHGRTLVTTMPADAQDRPPQPEQAQLLVEGRRSRALLRVRAELVDRMVNEAGEVTIAQSRIIGEMRAM